MFSNKSSFSFYLSPLLTANPLFFLSIHSIMFKKSKYKRIGFGTTYKKRYFCITTQHFFYAKTKNKSPLFKLPISEISVKKISTDGFKNVCIF